MFPRRQDVVLILCMMMHQAFNGSNTMDILIKWCHSPAAAMSNLTTRPNLAQDGGRLFPDSSRASKNRGQVTSGILKGQGYGALLYFSVFVSIFDVAYFAFVCLDSWWRQQLMTPWPADGGPLCYVRSYASTAGALGSHTCWKHSSFFCQNKVYCCFKKQFRG